ncbi:hypothetical protein CG471_29680 [Sphingobium sp. IP1]|uniref:transposase n=1 Tax=Sphingobium sp. IP1 TaxID=2021637 RepID=UPI000C083A9A|nr:transposase [Sphingobium sp. IP1]PHP16164.1 hypothetical protein CG471_29680 [Sphingobium sp. IP1]
METAVWPRTWKPPSNPPQPSSTPPPPCSCYAVWLGQREFRNRLSGGQCWQADNRVTRSQKNGHVNVRYGNARACRDCALKPQCASGVRRTIDRWEGEAVLECMAERLAVRPDIIDRRRETVEHPFGTIKQWMNQGAFLMRGLANVNAEFSLTALAYNLRRAINILGIPALLRAVQA